MRTQLFKRCKMTPLWIISGWLHFPSYMIMYGNKAYIRSYTAYRTFCICCCVLCLCLHVLCLCLHVLMAQLGHGPGCVTLFAWATLPAHLSTAELPALCMCYHCAVLSHPQPPHQQPKPPAPPQSSQCFLILNLHTSNTNLPAPPQSSQCFLILNLHTSNRNLPAPPQSSIEGSVGFLLLCSLFPML